MEQHTNKRFTLTSGKGRIYGLIAILFAVMLLAGCSNNVSEINSSTPGFFNHYIVFPLSYLIQHIASIFNGSYGVSDYRNYTCHSSRIVTAYDASSQVPARNTGDHECHETRTGCP